MYLSYGEYTDMGGTLSNAAFHRLEFKARMLIDQHTFGRLKGLTEQPESVKKLMFELVAVEQKEENGVIQSVSNDGYSETYAVANNEQKAVCLIVAYLAQEKTEDGTPLLYRGVM
jgi:hypothetical protein